MLIDQSIRHFGTLLHFVRHCGIRHYGIRHSGMNPLKHYVMVVEPMILPRKLLTVIVSNVIHIAWERKAKIVGILNTHGYSFTIIFDPSNICGSSKAIVHEGNIYQKIQENGERSWWKCKDRYCKRRL